MCDSHLHGSRELRNPSRRRLMALGAAGAVAAALPAVRRGHAASPAVPPTELSADAVLERLLDGNARFSAGEHLERPPTDWAALARGQAPVAVILGCADSRVPIELVFDQGPGDLFVVRVAGNFVTAYGLASIEYAVAFLQVPLVVVLGHGSCGAVGAAVEAVQRDAHFPGEIDRLVEHLTPAVRRARDAGAGDLVEAAVEENVRENVARLETAGEVLPPLVAGGRLRVVGAVDDIASGRVRLI